MPYFKRGRNDQQDTKRDIRLKNGEIDMLCSDDLNCGIKVRTKNSCLPSYSKCSNEVQQKQICKCDRCKEAHYKWGSWGECSKKCDCGVRYQYGTCPINKVCKGSDTRKESCNCQKCPVSTLLNPFLLKLTIPKKFYTCVLIFWTISIYLKGL